MKFLGFVLFGLKLVGFLIHIWTLFIAYNLYGVFGAILAFFMPIISEIYLFVLSWGLSGVMLTTYNTAIIVYIVGFVVWWVLALAINSTSDSNY